MNKQVLQKFSNVYREVKKVYSDCSTDFDSACSIRQLNYCSDKFVDIDTAVNILNDCMTGYNNFVPSILNNLKKIDEKGKVYIAREGSVAIYFASKLTKEEEDLVEYFGEYINAPAAINEMSKSGSVFINSSASIRSKSKKIFQSLSSVLSKMLTDECNMFLISKLNKIYSFRDVDGRWLCVDSKNHSYPLLSQPIFPQNISLDSNTKFFRFWWD